jgi:hypothetical protein
MNIFSVIFLNIANDGLLDVCDIADCNGGHDGVHVVDHGGHSVGCVKKVTIQNAGGETSVACHEVHICEVDGLEYVYVGDDIDRGVGGVTKAII